MKNLIIAALLLGATFTGGAAIADEHEISGNVALATEYRFRGISQTGRDPAIQGGFDYAHESGIYVGTWASNVSFTEGGTEIDVYAGWGTDLNENLALDLGVLYYGYPSENSDAGYWEIYGSLSFFGATVGLNYSPEYTYDTDDFFYLYGSYSLPLGEMFSLDMSVGLNQFKGDNLDSFLGAVDAGKSYIDYNIGVSTSLAGVDLSLAYVGTDIDRSDCFGGTKDCKGNAVFTISKSL